MFIRKPLILAAVCLSVAASAHAQKKDDPGASDTEIRIGDASPHGGPASAYGAISAYMGMSNALSGINGHKVNFISYDHQYSPPKTSAVTRRLVEQDEVLVLSGNVSTEPNLAVQCYLITKKVSQLMILVGTEKFNGPKNFPWTVPFNQGYMADGRFSAQNILRTKPDAKIAVLYPNDDFGNDLLKDLMNGLGDMASKMIVGEASSETSCPSVDSQKVQSKSTGANAFVNFSMARAAAKAIRKVQDRGWCPDQQYVTYVSAYVMTSFESAGLDSSVGVMSMRLYKNADQARWNIDPEPKDYKEFLSKYMTNEDINNSLAVYGYIRGQVLEYVLKTAGDNLTRKNLLKQATSIRDVHFNMLMPGITACNTPTDYFPINTMQMVRFNDKELEPVGKPVNLKQPGA